MKSEDTFNKETANEIIAALSDGIKVCIATVDEMFSNVNGNLEYSKSLKMME